MPTPGCILLVAPKADETTERLRDALASSGCQVVLAGAYDEVFEELASLRFDTIVVDYNSEISCIIDCCRTIRSEHYYLPLLVLEDASSPVDRMLLLEAGADACLPREVDPRELFTLNRALLRRDEWCSCTREEASARGAVRVGRLHVCPLKKRVYFDGTDVDLTHVEFQILYLLAQHPGRVYSREDILRSLWGDQYMCEPHTVDTHICRLRKKIEPDLAEPRYIQTVWGFGYRFGLGDRLPMPDGRATSPS